MLRYPEFAQWCGTERTADWHTRFNAKAVVYGHLHIPRTTWEDGVRFEEVSLGYPRGVECPHDPAAGAAGRAAGGRRGRVASTTREDLMIERILPPGPAVAAELFTDETVGLFPGGAGGHRQRRGQAAPRVHHGPRLRPPGPGRARPAARPALIPGERGAPAQPDGITGSMTHCDGYRGAVLARTTDLASIGLDAEPNLPLPNGVERTIALPAERDHVAELASGQPGVCWDRLLFCAKEAVYKAWFPVAGKWLGFEQAQITFSADSPAS